MWDYELASIQSRLGPPVWISAISAGKREREAREMRRHMEVCKESLKIWYKLHYVCAQASKAEVKFDSVCWAGGWKKSKGATAYIAVSVLFKMN